MQEKKEFKSNQFPSEQQLYDLNTKGRFCLFPDMPVDPADKVPSSSKNKTSDACPLLPNIEAGHSFSGKPTADMVPANSEEKVPHGYKKMTVFNQKLNSFCLATVPENTPPLTQEEIEQYTRLNPI